MVGPRWKVNRALSPGRRTITVSSTDSVAAPARLSGVLLVIAGTVAFAFNVIIAPFIYASGADPLTLITFRNVVITVLLGGFLALMGKPIDMPVRERFYCIGIGVLMTAQTLSFFTAISLIPVSIGTLIEYTYPFQVAIVARYLYGESLSRMRVLMMVGALTGLLLVVEVGGPRAELNGFGVILMVVASMLLTGKIMTTHRVLLSVDSRRTSLYLSATVAVVCSLVYLLSPLEPAWPQTSLGWLLLSVAPGTSLAGMLLFYTGLARIGPGSTSMLANFEPVFILLFAIALLGETFTILQTVGAVAVMVCVVSFQRARN